MFAATLQVYVEIARIYERKAHADMVDDSLRNARDEMDDFVHAHYRTKFGIEKIATRRLRELHDNCLNLIKKVGCVGYLVCIYIAAIVLCMQWI